jgi:hypothetical protein
VLDCPKSEKRERELMTTQIEIPEITCPLCDIELASTPILESEIKETLADLRGEAIHTLHEKYSEITFEHVIGHQPTFTPTPIDSSLQWLQDLEGELDENDPRQYMEKSPAVQAIFDAVKQAPDEDWWGATFVLANRLLHRLKDTGRSW